MTLLAVTSPISIYWHLPLLVLVISLVYSATRYDDLGAILGETVRWGSRMLGFLLAIAVVLTAAAWYI